MGDPLLVVHRLRFAYPNGKLALDGIELEINATEKVALLGPNGAGKSTLIQHLNGLLSGEGNVRVAGLPVERGHLREIRRRVGILFQDPDDQLFCPTLEEDVAFGPQNFGVPEDKLKARVDSALEAVGMTAHRHNAPFQMSFGERKRAALATVLACQPELLALDEPSSNLDPFHRRRLINWMRQYPKAILLATHDLDLALDTTERAILLTDGKIVADDATEIILRDRNLLEKHGLELPLRLQCNA